MCRKAFIYVEEKELPGVVKADKLSGDKRIWKVARVGSVGMCSAEGERLMIGAKEIGLEKS